MVVLVVDAVIVCDYDDYADVVMLMFGGVDALLLTIAMIADDDAYSAHGVDDSDGYLCY